MPIGVFSKRPERTDVIGSGMETVAGAIAAAKQQLGPAFIETAIHSFSWAAQDEFACVKPDLLTSKKAPLVGIGFIDSPAEYLERLSNVPGRNGLPSILKQLRTKGFDFNAGIGMFVGHPMLQVLRELNVPAGIHSEAFNTSVLPTLDQLLHLEKRKGADPAMLQKAGDTLAKMMLTLKELADASMHLRIGMLQNIRV